MTRPMRLAAAAALLFMGLAAASAADEQKRADTPSASADTPAPEREEPDLSSPLPLSAEDMLRAMETMSAHGDDDACCRARKKNASESEHAH